MKKYTFTLLIEEITDVKPIANSILEELELERQAKEKAKELNNQVELKRLEILEKLLPIIKSEITEPLGIKSCYIEKHFTWLNKNYIAINKCFTSHKNQIRIEVRTPVYNIDNFGNNIYLFEPEIYFVKKIEYRGEYHYKFTNIEDFYNTCKEELREYHIYNKNK